jgi:hypothetical protein
LYTARERGMTSTVSPSAKILCKHIHRFPHNKIETRRRVERCVGTCHLIQAPAHTPSISKFHLNFCRPIRKCVKLSLLKKFADDNLYAIII